MTKLTIHFHRLEHSAAVDWKTKLTIHFQPIRRQVEPSHWRGGGWGREGVGRILYHYVLPPFLTICTLKVAQHTLPCQYVSQESSFRRKQTKKHEILLHFQKFSTNIKSHQLMQNINLLHFSCMERGFNV